jgi:hypothetical protein
MRHGAQRHYSRDNQEDRDCEADLNWLSRFTCVPRKKS